MNKSNDYFDSLNEFFEHQLQLNILSFGPNGEYNGNEYYIDISVSLDQAGFPYQVTLLDDNNQEYNAVTTIQSSPLLYGLCSENSTENP